MDVSNKIIKNGKEIKLSASEIAIGSKENSNTLDKMVDYVIEQGENYTKWASGKLECWGKVTYTNLSIDGTDVAGVRYRNIDITFEKDFIVPPVVNANVSISGWMGSVGRVTPSSNGARTHVYIVGSNVIHGRTVDIYFEAIGRWK